MGLANDNMWGYASPLIKQYRVRFIEMAAVVPVWTSMMVFYIEGDYGHLMNEVVAGQRFRTAVRGHCFSLLMPWVDIIEELSRNVSDADLEALPREEETLKYIVRLHLRVGNKSFHNHLKQVH